MSFPRYEKYKDSGIEWLGDVPEHWAVKRLRFVCEMNPSKSELAGMDKAILVSFLPMEAIGDDGSLDLSRERAISEVETGYTFFRDGDVTFAKITPCFENGKGALMHGMLNGIGFGTTELIVARPKRGETFGKYLHWLFVSSPFMNLGESYMYGAGGQKRVPDDFVRNFAIAFPPLAEQSAIADLLDRETAKIDVLVEEQRRLIELLKEKRQAVISHAVTKGLNPQAPMKDSGIEWLGEVPANWDICLLKRAFRSVDYGISDSLDSEGVVAILRMGNIENGKVVTDDLKYTNSVDPFLLLQPGDLLYNRTNSLDLIGKVGMFLGSDESPVSFASYLVRLRTVDESLPDFFAYLLNTEDILGLARANAFVAIGQCNLNPTRYGQITIAIPPRAEQAAIVKHLNTKIAQLDILTAEASHAIDLLQERRSALISAAVTGKIDICGDIAASSAIEKSYSTGFARQLLAAEILHHCHDHPTTGRVKLQKLIHLCEYVAEIEEVNGNYLRKAAGPFDNKVMFGIASGLSKQKWFSEVKDGNRTIYRPLEKAGEHKKYLARWESKMRKINEVLGLLGKAATQQCEIVSTLYAAWNDLLIEGRVPSDEEIIHEASDPVRWHENKANIPSDKWPKALKWMRDHGLVPKGYGSHTRHDDVAKEPA